MSTAALQSFFTIFIAVFLAELGDKTQLATMLFASDSNAAVSKWTVFIAASAALTLSAGIGVVAGSWLGTLVSPRTLQLVAGAGFLLIGAWTVYKAWSL
ncbi:MAG: TMEM165/GDT1 family protein [Burkholderiaceae bacterium]